MVVTTVSMTFGSGLRRSAADVGFGRGDLHLVGVALGIALGRGVGLEIVAAFVRGSKSWRRLFEFKLRAALARFVPVQAQLNLAHSALYQFQIRSCGLQDLAPKCASFCADSAHQKGLIPKLARQVRRLAGHSVLGQIKTLDKTHNTSELQSYKKYIYECTHIHACIHTHARTYTYTQIHTHTHTRK